MEGFCGEACACGTHLAIDGLQAAAKVATTEPLGLIHLGHLVGVLVYHLQVALQPRAAVLRALRRQVCPCQLHSSIPSR